MTREPALEQKRIIVEGRVQGVGFRFFARDAALALGLRGTVRNLPDGRRVEAVVQGDATAVGEFLAAISAGPNGAFVSGVTVTDQPVAPGLSGFRIVH